MTAHQLEQAIGAYLLLSVLVCALWAAVAAGLKRRSFTRHTNTAPGVVDARRPARRIGSWR